MRIVPQKVRWDSCVKVLIVVLSYYSRCQHVGVVGVVVVVVFVAVSSIYIAVWHHRVVAGLWHCRGRS